MKRLSVVPLKPSVDAATLYEPLLSKKTCQDRVHLIASLALPHTTPK